MPVNLELLILNVPSRKNTPPQKQTSFFRIFRIVIIGFQRGVFAMLPDQSICKVCFRTVETRRENPSLGRSEKPRLTPEFSHVLKGTSSGSHVAVVITLIAGHPSRP